MPDLKPKIIVASARPIEQPQPRSTFKRVDDDLHQKWMGKRRLLSILLTKQGASHADMGRYAEAIKFFDQALRFDPKNEKALKHRALAKMSLDLNREALADLNLILKRDPENKFALHHRGLIHCKLKKNERCIDDLTRSLGVENSNKGNILGMIAMAHAQRGRFAKAMTNLQASAKIEGRYGQAVRAMKYMRAVPLLSLGVHALYRPSRGGAFGARTGFDANWYLYNFNSYLTLGAKLSLGYAAGTENHALDLAAGAMLIAEFKHTKLNGMVEAGYNFGIHGDPLDAANKPGGLFRYGLGVDFRLWKRLWMGVAVTAQHDTDDFRDASVGVGARFIANIW